LGVCFTFGDTSASPPGMPPGRRLENEIDRNAPRPLAEADAAAHERWQKIRVSGTTGFTKQAAPGAWMSTSISTDHIASKYQLPHNHTVVNVTQAFTQVVAGINFAVEITTIDHTDNSSHTWRRLVHQTPAAKEIRILSQREVTTTKPSSTTNAAQLPLAIVGGAIAVSGIAVVLLFLAVALVITVMRRTSAPLITGRDSVEAIPPSSKGGTILGDEETTISK